MPTQNITHTTIPSALTQGDQLGWLITPAQYPLYEAQNGWVMQYTVINQSAKWVIDSAQDGLDHRINLDSAVTATWLPGTYDWQLKTLRVGDGLAYTLVRGTLTIAPDFANFATYDARSQLRRSLDNIRAVLENRATSAAQEYQIAGRMLKYIPIADLIVLESKFKLDLARQQQATANAAAQAAATASGVPLAPRGRIIRRFV